MIVRPDVLRIWHRRGAFKFGKFRYKYHENNPDLPPEPTYLNLRLSPKGPLTPEDVEVMGGQVLYRFARHNGVLYKAVVGVPEAGDSFAMTFARAAGVPQLYLRKEETAEGRRIIPGNLEEQVEAAGLESGDPVVVVDDLVTRADSKFEAIAPLKSLGLRVQSVLVFVDREQGGVQVLKREGVRVFAVWTFSQILAFYRSEELATEEDYQRAMRHLETQQEALRRKEAL
ncbi:MAG: hypothetical protein Q8R13_01325 [bacterium]|nr:hypothetical protein [bacterium]MDZ4296675.1 hypothetical protein [Patescibacteria group bacterium]